MLINHNIVNKELAEELNIDIADIKSVSHYVFGGIKSWMRNPTSLILNVKGLGKFYHSKSKVEDKLEKLLNRGELFPHETMEGRLSEIAKYEFLLEEYRKYLELKYKYRNGDYPEKPKCTQRKKSD